MSVMVLRLMAVTANQSEVISVAAAGATRSSTSAACSLGHHSLRTRTRYIPRTRLYACKVDLLPALPAVTCVGPSCMRLNRNSAVDDFLVSSVNTSFAQQNDGTLGVAKTEAGGLHGCLECSNVISFHMQGTAWRACCGTSRWGWKARRAAPAVPRPQRHARLEDFAERHQTGR